MLPPDRQEALNELHGPVVYDFHVDRIPPGPEAEHASDLMRVMVGLAFPVRVSFLHTSDSERYVDENGYYQKDTQVTCEEAGDVFKEHGTPELAERFFGHIDTKNSISTLGLPAGSGRLVRRVIVDG